MIKDIKKLRKLLKLKEKGEAQMRVEGFTIEMIKKAIETQKNKVMHELNNLGWFLVFLIFIPLALMQFGLKWEIAFMVSYFFGGIITFILHKLIGCRL